MDLVVYGPHILITTLSATGMGMNLDMAGIDHQPFVIRFFDQIFLKLGPNPLVAPTTKATMSVFPVPVIRRLVSPGSSCAKNPENSIDKQSVIANHASPMTFCPSRLGAIKDHTRS